MFSNTIGQRVDYVKYRPSDIRLPRPIRTNKQSLVYETIMNKIRIERIILRFTEIYSDGISKVLVILDGEGLQHHVAVIILRTYKTIEEKDHSPDKTGRYFGYETNQHPD